MNASCNEAKRPRKWFISVIAALIAVVSCASIMAPHSAYAEPEEESTNAREECISSGHAKSLGWIVCPVMLFLADSAEDVYGWVSERLEIDSINLLSESSVGGSATHTAWGVFRNFANIAFGLLFMVVVISQISGIGINNYGIKKILPKLIVTAILVNVSYYLCLIAVDISNIVGSSLNSLLTNLPPAWSASGDAAAVLGVTILMMLIAGGAGVVAIVLNPAILLSLLVGALGLLISLFTLFVLLAAREVVIVVLVVASPIALVCYMLPNTKKVFDKWLKLGEGVLFVYPICSLMVGGGSFVARIMMTGDDIGFWVAFTALLASIAPIFFIPKVLTSAFAVAGNIGAKVMSAGARIRGGAEKGMRNTGAYKGAQARGLERRNRIMAGVDTNGKQKDLGRFSRLWRGGDRNVAASRQAYLKDVESKNRVEDMMGTGFESAIANVEEKASAVRTADYESLLNNGKAALDDGTIIVVNDAASVGRYHAQALKRFANASNDSERAEAMAQIKAAQNILSKTDKGRTQVQTNLQNSLAAGETGALTAAASHLMGAYADKYKAVNRGAHSLISDLSTTNFGTDPSALGTMQGNLSSGKYEFTGHDKYTAESLVNADEAAIESFAHAIDTGSPNLTTDARSNIQATAYEALQKQQAGTLNIKPEVKKQLERIVAGYTPTATPNSRAQMISHGAFEDSAGNVVHLREMDNGKFLDDGGYEVDITHYKRH